MLQEKEDIFSLKILHKKHIEKLVSYFGLECSFIRTDRMIAALRKHMARNEEAEDLILISLKDLKDFKTRLDHNLKELKKPALKEMVTNYKLPPKVGTYQKCRMMHVLSQHILENYDLTRILKATSESPNEENYFENLDETDRNILKMCEGCGNDWPENTILVHIGHTDCWKAYGLRYEEMLKNAKKSSALKWYQRNKEIVREKQKDWCEKNKQLVTEQKKEWYEKNKESVREQQTEYKQENKLDLIKKKRLYDLIQKLNFHYSHPSVIIKTNDGKITIGKVDRVCRIPLLKSIIQDLQLDKPKLVYSLMKHYHKPFKCVFCPRWFTCLEKEEQHIINDHDDISIYLPNINKRTWNRVMHWLSVEGMSPETVIKDHYDDTIQNLKISDMDFKHTIDVGWESEEECLEMIRAAHYFDIKSLYYCGIKFLIFNMVSRMSHDEIQQTFNVSYFKCDPCGLKLRTWDVFKEHNASKHKNDVVFPCTRCYNTYTRNLYNWNDLQKHYKLYHDYFWTLDVGRYYGSVSKIVNQLDLQSLIIAPKSPLIIKIIDPGNPMELSTGVFLKYYSADYASIKIEAKFPKLDKYRFKVVYSKKEKRHYSTTLIGRKKVMMSSHLGCPQNCRKDGCSQQLIYDLCLYDGLCYDRCDAKILVDTDDEVPIHDSVIEFTQDCIEILARGGFLISHFKIVYSPPKQDIKTFDEILYKHRQDSFKVNLIHLCILILSLNYFYF